MRILAVLGVAAIVTLGFNVITSFDADAAGKRRVQNWCPPMTTTRR